MKDRIEFHPAYGYATQEQIELLRTLCHGPDYNQVWKDIEKQTKNCGKSKK